MHRSWIWAIGIDAAVAIGFLAFLIAQTMATGDTDIEKLITLGITPVALGMNTTLLVGLLAILQQRHPHPLRTLLLAAAAWLAAYPSFYLGSQVSTALRFNPATQEAAGLWVFFLVPWAISLGIGAAGARWAMGAARRGAAEDRDLASPAKSMRSQHTEDSLPLRLQGIKEREEATHHKDTRTRR